MRLVLTIILFFGLLFICGCMKHQSSVNYPDTKGSGLVIPNFVSGLTDGRRFTPTDTEFEDKPNGRQ
jgi:hypothetical protein